MWRRLVATPVFDSRLTTRTAGVRSLGTGMPRLMYTADGYDIDLQVRPGSPTGRVRLLGQILNEDFEPASGRVKVEGAFGAVESDLDACGHFAVDGLTASGHHVEIVLADALIEIPTVYL
jgi:hypothetical protein